MIALSNLIPSLTVVISNAEENSKELISIKDMMNNEKVNESETKKKIGRGMKV